MREIRQSNAEELEKLCREVQLVPTANLRGLSLIVDGEAVLIVGYDGWTDGSCVMHQWCKHPRYYGRRMMHEVFRYAFEIAGLQVVLGTVRSDNPHALEINRKLGFQTAAVVPDAYGPGVDLHLLSLSRHQCKW
jgi:RimJ/RimL family protein N-acetyltransferase